MDEREGPPPSIAGFATKPALSRAAARLRAGNQCPMWKVSLVVVVLMATP
ncbi:hypothetical protein SBRY_30652 [Actinacidiphila bryophytorum]|uniref:Uncharacterized protein n=1 Tax=Actinacidiphila bryophytorum TaxID=1436133 RepID=A0A9W4H1D1_9ACTN|nr:hypothetical protein SBRY_30652 [Actinacidiphila bryophytorum]